MAITGAGNPTGGTAGTSKSLTYIQNYVYAYSGDVVLTSAFADMASFHSGSDLILAEITIGGNFDAVATSSLAFRVSLNDVVIVDTETSGGNDPSAPFNMPYTLIIPPETNVIIQMRQLAGGNIAFQTTLTGRVYR